MHRPELVDTTRRVRGTCYAALSGLLLAEGLPPDLREDCDARRQVLLDLLTTCEQVLADDDDLKRMGVRMYLKHRVPQRRR